MASIPHQVVVHVIEGRGLCGLDSSGTSDALCSVEIGPTSRLRKATVHQPETNNALWEKAFMFDEVWLTEEQFSSEKIAFKVFDRNDILRNELIGAVELSLSFVYRKRSRSIQRVWLPLHIPSDASSQRGQIRVSVFVLRPDDPTPTFGAFMYDDNGTVLEVPPSHHRPFQLNVLVYRAENVLNGRTTRIKPFVSIRFNGNTVRTATRPNQANPIFNRRFEMPFYIPLTSDSIEVILWNEVTAGQDEFIGKLVFAQNELTYKPWGPKWACFYSYPPQPSSFIGQVFDTFKGKHSSPSEYAGRVLLRLSVNSNKRPKLMSMPLDTMSDEPETETYVLKLHLYSCSDVPVVGGQMFVEVSFGGLRQQSPAVHGHNGAFMWNFNFRELKATLPRDLTQVPDLILSLYHRVGLITSKTAFVRLTAVDLLSDAGDWAVNGRAPTPLGTHWRPQWRSLQTARYDGDDVVPGFILVSIGFGLQTPDVEGEISRPLLSYCPTPLVVRCRVVSAARLPAASDAALSNPFVVIRVAGRTVRTQTVSNTLFPFWDEELFVYASIDVNLAPHIVVLLYHDVGGIGSSPQFLARTELSLPLGAHNRAGLTRYPLFDDDERRDAYLLASFELMTPKTARHIREKPKEVVLKTDPIGLMVQSIGVRSSLAAGVAKLVSPSIEVSVPDLSPGAKPGAEIMQLIPPALVTSDADGAVELRQTLHFSRLLVPIEHLDGFAIKFRVFDNGATGRFPFAFAHLTLADVMCCFEGGRLQPVRVENEVLWYSPKSQTNVLQGKVPGNDIEPTKNVVEGEHSTGEDAVYLELDPDCVNVNVSPEYHIQMEGEDLFISMDDELVDTDRERHEVADV